MTGDIAVIGSGPGDAAQLTLAAYDALQQADVIVAYAPYLEHITHIAPQVPRESSRMGQEVARVNRVVDLALAGSSVALVSGGDAGIYGMAGLVFEVLAERGAQQIPVEVYPGISALNAAAALLGAPLMGDFAVVSLSDRLTPLDDILDRVMGAVQAGFVLCLYNPKSKGRVRPFERACDILLQCLAPQTPVGVVRAACRTGQQVSVITLEQLPEAEIAMDSIIIVGNRRTVLLDGRMVTRRGYEKKYDLSGGL